MLVHTIVHSFLTPFLFLFELQEVVQDHATADGLQHGGNA